MKCRGIRADPGGQVIEEKSVRRVQCELDEAEAGEGTVKQRLAHGITDEQRAGQDRAGDRRTEQHAAMRARMKSQAPPDESPTRHEENLHDWNDRKPEPAPRKPNPSRAPAALASLLAPGGG